MHQYNVAWTGRVVVSDNGKFGVYFQVEKRDGVWNYLACKDFYEDLEEARKFFDQLQTSAFEDRRKARGKAIFRISDDVRGFDFIQAQDF